MQLLTELPLTFEFELIKEGEYLISLLGIVKECPEATEAPP